jgi:hypothetical protein
MDPKWAKMVAQKWDCHSAVQSRAEQHHRKKEDRPQLVGLFRPSLRRKKRKEKKHESVADRKETHVERGCLHLRLIDNRVQLRIVVQEHHGLGYLCELYRGASWWQRRFKICEALHRLQKKKQGVFW